MRLRGVEFGKIFCAPGARNFFGDGYPFHKYWKHLGMTWDGTGFVSKTTTLQPRKGNMPLEVDSTMPEELFPKCIVVKPLSGHVLNAVGLSGPGAANLLERGIWQAIRDPFSISFMSVAKTRPEREGELRDFVALLGRYLPFFQAQVALQINWACPNTGVYHQDLAEEVVVGWEIARGLGIPLVANFNPVTPVEVLGAGALYYDALWIGNTIPWGTKGIDWKKIFGSEISPLRSRGIEQDGGLSGPVCLPFTIASVRKVREYIGSKVPIVAGNGIQKIQDLLPLQEVGASAVAIGVVGMVRPWAMKYIIEGAHSAF
jgi:dihydroorotate dehydrogenase